MKKFSTLFLSLLVFSLFLFVNGVNAEGTRSKSLTAERDQEINEVEEVDEVEVEDEIEDEDEDEDEDETDKSRERNELGEENGELLREREEVSSDSAKERMGEVAKQVQVLLEMREEGEGIGQKVREIAKEQVKSQEKIAEKLAKMEEKKIWLKKMFGYDREAVLSVQEEIAANRLRISELLKLQEETSDKIEIAELEDAINALVDQNASLQDAVQEEMKNQGVWSWFRNFFNKS